MIKITSLKISTQYKQNVSIILQLFIKSYYIMNNTLVPATRQKCVFKIENCKVDFGHGRVDIVPFFKEEITR